MSRTHHKGGRVRKVEVSRGEWVPAPAGCASIYARVSGLVVTGPDGLLRPVAAVTSGQYPERAGWTAADLAAFTARVEAFNAGRRWETEGGAFQ